MKLVLDSDTCAGAHPRVLQWLGEINQKSVPAYGSDEYTQQAEQVLRKHFGKKVKAYFALTGTAANVLALKPLLSPYGAVICTDIAHINVAETGAVEAQLGVKLLTVPHQSGKLTIEGIEPHLNALGNRHMAQPQVISLSQATEYGTVYRVEEVRALCEFAHEHGLLVHMDGARLSNAAASLGVSLAKLTFDAGVDVLSFGLTKNGAMLAESVLFRDESLAAGMEFYQKQLLQLACKMRFVSGQFIPFLEEGLWLSNAQHANAMAARLAKGIAAAWQVTPNYPVETNSIFISLSDAQLQKLQTLASVQLWRGAFKQVRMVTAFDTAEADIDALLKQLG